MFRRMILVVQLLLSLQIINTASSSNFYEANCSGILHKTLLKKGLIDGQLQMSECPPWFQLDNQTGACHPGPQLGGIIQQDMHTFTTRIQICYCMTEQGGTLAVGTCVYACGKSSYYPLPCHVSELNFTCTDFNRRGLLCGQCMDTYGHICTASVLL